MEHQKLSETPRPPRRVPLSARKNSQAGYLRLLSEALMEEEWSQRALLAQRVGLSRLAVSELLAGLEENGFVAVDGAIGGAPGRSERRYSLKSQAALAVGLDIGGTKIAGSVADMRGTILAEINEPTSRGSLADLVDQASRLIDTLCAAAEMPRYRVRALAVGVPAAVHPTHSSLSFADNLPGLQEGHFAEALRAALDVDVLIDNDVNLALLGELVHSDVQRRENVAFVALGTGIGGALVVDGKLLRGAHGGAGEVGYLPLFAGDGQGAIMEDRVGEAGIRRAYVASGGSPDHSVREIFEAASEGVEAAIQTLDTTADHVARAVLAILALVDPDRVVLGGSVGSRMELIDRVRLRIAQAWPRDIDLQRSHSGGRAGLLGAVELARESMLKALFGAHPERD
ncbi:Sugar kinase of the NBD/HSP70 family, may contain an N-terminal HTH domain [Devosia lucknowensis]|uniref:Sugar kinase of the NBD/HSP70 family, may contain an N-terminal HTH domain n=1 Tax=Devosia lucknowensis TaxID=1096929 RepID=A0A1Y6EK57_9HYPH|nr:ROK family transcriptional regulator [Devosia lucknowensis]SMQ63005.1 Sugar kinase of the NBD/HSP70 family, may contain an N-terminal HTH domain [Devosia lucknowensis]